MIIQNSRSEFLIEITWVEIVGAMVMAFLGACLARVGAATIGWQRSQLFWRLFLCHGASWGCLVASEYCHLRLYRHPSDGAWAVASIGSIAALHWFGNRWAFADNGRVLSALLVTVFAYGPIAILCTGCALAFHR
jgi:hypothetical protein